MSDKKIIEYYMVKRFGRLDRYIIDKQFKKDFYRLTGRTSLSDFDMKFFSKLGIEFKKV